MLSPLRQRRSSFSEAILHPRVTFSAGQPVMQTQIACFHEPALRDCFSAACVKTGVTIAIA